MDPALMELLELLGKPAPEPTAPPQPAPAPEAPSPIQPTPEPHPEPESTSPPIVSDNLLRNASFDEAGVKYWENLGYASIVRANVHRGVAAIAVQGKAGGIGQYVDYPATPGQSFTISLWSKSFSRADVAYAGLTFYDAYGAVIADPCEAIHTGPGYKETVFSLIVPKGTARIFLWVWKSEGTGPLCLDTFSLKLDPSHPVVHKPVANHSASAVAVSNASADVSISIKQPHPDTATNTD